jgi:hypothetical protein
MLVSARNRTNRHASSIAFPYLQQQSQTAGCRGFWNRSSATGFDRSNTLIPVHESAHRQILNAELAFYFARCAFDLRASETWGIRVANKVVR